LLIGGLEEDDEGKRNVVYVYHYYDGEEGGGIYLRIDKVNSETGEIELSTDEVPFCFNVSSVSYEPQYVSESVNNAFAMKFDITISKFGSDYCRNEVLSLRNRPEVIRCDDLDIIDAEKELGVAIVNYQKILDGSEDDSGV
jgi:hypothetical protein